MTDALRGISHQVIESTTVRKWCARLGSNQFRGVEEKGKRSYESGNRSERAALRLRAKSVSRETFRGPRATCLSGSKSALLAHGWPMALALLLALSAPAAAEEPLRLVVVVTDHANVRGLERAQAYAERVFSAAGVAITWQDPSAQPCGGLTLFLTRASPGVAMGRSAVNDGVSWVFPNRVQLLAGQKNMDERVLLGRAIVHELGHLLHLGHARDGVMRAEIYTDAMEAKFAFTPAEARAIRERLESKQGLCSE